MTKQVKQHELRKKRNEDKQIIEKIGIEKRLMMLKMKEFKKHIKTREEEEYNVDIGISGCCCTLVIIKNEFIFHAHVGDSLAALSKIFVNEVHEKNYLNDYMILTKPIHVPSNTNELMRIYSKKGEVRGIDFKIPEFIE